MARKMDLWHSRLALAMSGLALTTTGMITGICVAKATCIPNFSLLAPPNGPEDGPVALWASPGHVWAGLNHIWPRHWLSSGQNPLQAKFQPSKPSPWHGRWTCGTPGFPWPYMDRP